MIFYVIFYFPQNEPVNKGLAQVISLFYLDGIGPVGNNQQLSVV
jgi:hypothetical protein